MKRILGLVLMVSVALGCAVWDYNAAIQSCIVNNVGDPGAREACMCAASRDAGRSCDYLDAGAPADAGVGQ